MNKLRKIAFRVALISTVMALPLLSVSSASAKIIRTTNQGIKGRVTCNGGGVYGATMETESSTGYLTQTTTSRDGSYVFYLNPGDYSVTALEVPNCVFYSIWFNVTVVTNHYVYQDFAF
jgi:hypothetical protein